MQDFLTSKSHESLSSFFDLHWDFHNFPQVTASNRSEVTGTIFNASNSGNVTDTKYLCLCTGMKCNRYNFFASVMVTKKLLLDEVTMPTYAHTKCLPIAEMTNRFHGQH
jgi:hypothetical protein